MRLSLAIAALVVGLAAPAGADDTIWDRALQSEDDPERIFEQEMRRGEKHAQRSFTRRFSKHDNLLVRKAVRAFENALEAKPDAVEPHLRIAELLHSHYLSDPAMARGPYGEALMRFDPRVARRVIEHWSAFERKAPLDPRITEHVLFERALVYTKLGSEDDHRSALADYRRLLSRTDRNDLNYGIYLYNHAEILMMLGKLDEAIPTYQRALRHSSKPEYAFSLAVALDRDRQGARARELLARYVEDERHLAPITSEGIFFVPAGELYYYLGLSWEVIGDPQRAIRFYEKFIRSGAHPRYQSRAREHIERLRDEGSGGSE